jgi:predicted ATPase/class 3 adenylate cyclase
MGVPPRPLLDVPGFDVGALTLTAGDHQSFRAVRQRDGRSVLLKLPTEEHPNPKAVARLRHEYELTHDLVSDRVVHALDFRPAGGAVALVLEDPGGGTLRDLIHDGGVPRERFLRIAIRLSAALADVHALGLVHKDLKPESVVLLAGDETRLTDFGVAMRLSRHNAPELAPGMLEGTLAYLAPEQTGRMNRPVDRRSDLYALGVTLYELLTGVRPFRAADPVKLVHQHLAVRPPSPAEHRPDVEGPIADIILKLLEKNPESRYQTAAGLQRDLERCLSARSSFPLGTEDASDEFRIPPQLFGRNREVGVLKGALGRAAGGAVELLLVHGPSGIGKSALVGELRREAAAASALQIAGKFDQYNRELPFLGFLRAFAQLARQMLTESEDRLSTWRGDLAAALTPNARLLVELVPEFAAVLRDTPEVAPLGLAESQTRFSLTIRRFLRTVATAAHPLVLFLDDVQWADAASIALLHTLLTDPQLSHLLLVAAYRDNEIDAAHPFLMLLGELEAAGDAAPARLAVGPLDEDAVAALLAEMLRASEASVRTLARTVLLKTGGNPFFVNEFLRSLHKGGEIRFDPARARWIWDDDAIGRRRTTDNVVDLVVERILGLPKETQDIVQLAAVIGHRFDLATLSRVSQGSRRGAAALIRPALAADILLPLDDDFKYADLVDTAFGNGYAFLHDRVRQAAYGLIAEGARPALHRRVGWLLLDGGESGDILFDAVNHLDAALSAVTDPEERLRIASLNLRAARKANLSMAWQAARRYAETGRALLAGAEPKGLAWELGFEQLRTAFLLGDHAAIGPLHAELVETAPSAHEAVLATEIKVQYLTSNMKYAEALDAGIPALLQLGVRLPRHGNKAQVVRELVRTKWALRGRDVSRLLELPQATDAGVRVAMRLLVTVSAAAYATDPDVFPQIVFQLVRMSLRHGNTPESAFGYVCYGLALCAVLRDFDGGLAFGRLALGMVDRLGARELEARVRFLYALFIQVWSEPLAETLAHFRIGASRGLESGDLEFYSYNFYGLDAHRLWTGAGLAELEKAVSAHRDAIVAQKQEKVSLLMLVVQDAIAWLRGAPEISFAGLDECEVLRLCEQRGDKTSSGYCQTFRCMRHALAHEWEAALVAATAARQRQEGLDGQIFVPVYQFYESLALLRSGRRSHRVRANQRRMAALAERVPATFAARFEIIEGERARARGRLGRALAHYERALSHAGAAANQHDLALAHELLGECLVAAKMTGSARCHLVEAARAWERWGATRLSEAICGRHPELVQREEAKSASAPTARSDELDLQSITRAAHTVAEKLKLPDVVQELLSLALSSAGASRGVLVLADGKGRFVVRATADVRDGVQLVDPLPLVDAGGIACGDAGRIARGDARAIAESVVQYTLRTRAPTLIDDVDLDHVFAADPHLQRARPRSVLCLPMLRHGEPTGALYLENELVTSAFTPGRVQFLTVLASQAAISIENAGLYQDLERSLEAQVALTSAHARFVPHQFLASLGRSDIREVRLGDHAAKVLSVLFSDIRGFTPLVESMSPAESIRFINAYLARMEPSIIANHGFVDSYIGDAIMALFDGSPDDAIAAGVGMLKALSEFNGERALRGEAPVRIGLGVNTGPLMLGTIGGQNNLKCGVIGDSVNLAARVESLTKQLEVPFLAGEDTVRRLLQPQRFLLRPVERVQVVGLKEPVTLHEIFDADPEPVRDAKERTLPRFLEGTEAYRARRWTEAAEAFQFCARECPDDQISRGLCARIELLSRNDPGPGWDGVVRMTKK